MFNAQIALPFRKGPQDAKRGGNNRVNSKRIAFRKMLGDRESIWRLAASSFVIAGSLPAATLVSSCGQRAKYADKSAFVVAIYDSSPQTRAACPKVVK